MNPSPHHPSAYDDDWTDAPASGPWPKWFGGVVIAIGFVAYGAYGLATGSATLMGENMSQQLRGTDARALATAYIGIGLFLHCHYFWGNVYHFSAMAVLGKVVSLVAIIGGLGYVIVRSFIG
jgi:fatty acid desaturase